MPAQNYNTAQNDSGGQQAPQITGTEALLSLSGLSTADALAPVVVGQTAGAALGVSGYDPSYGRAPGQGTTLQAGGTTVGDALLNFYKLPPDQMTAIQQDLLAGGFYDAGYYGSGLLKPQWGQADEASAKAFTMALRRAALTGKSLTDILSTAKAGFTPPEAKQRPQILKLTNSTDLAAAADAVARKTLGRRLSAGELTQFVNAYHSMETAAQQKEYAAGGQVDPTTGQLVGPGGTIEQPPNVNANTVDYQLRQEHPEEAKATDIHGGLNVVESMLKGNI